MKLIQSLIIWNVLAAPLVLSPPCRSLAETKPEASVHTPTQYHANLTRRVVPETPMAAPPVNTPFRDPDFGSRMVRVTDANTFARNPHWGNYLVGISFHTDSSGETNEWSKFDPSLGVHGGYRFWVIASGGFAVPFELDPITMRVTRIRGKRGTYLDRMGSLPVSGEFSYTDPDVLYGTWGTEILAYSFRTAKVKKIYDFDKCPGLPKHVTKHMHTGGFTISGDDTKFAFTFGGFEQDQSKLAVFYDRSAKEGAGACYWYDSKFGTVGGTNMAPTRVAAGVGQLAPPAPPKVTAHAGSGDLPPGNYYVELTAVSRLDQHFGETPASVETGPIHLASTGSLVITFPTLSNSDLLSLPPKNSGCWTNGPQCAPFNVYIGTSSGDETLQNMNGPVGGRTYVQSRPLNDTSQHPPKINTAGYTIHDARMSKSGTVVRVGEAFTATEYFWIPGTTRVIPCIAWQPKPQIAGYCGGHTAMGYSHAVSATGYFDDMGIVIHSLSHLDSWRLLINPLPSPQEWTESTHWSWTDADPSDTMPVCGTLYVDALVKGGDGSENLLSNPVLEIHRAWDRELVCLATTGQPKVWRFAHDRATGTSNASAPINSDFWAAPIGNVSQDGKFYLLSTNWEWGLGSEKGSSGCPRTGTCRSDVFVVELR